MEKEQNYTRYRLINYFDVWGNEEEGYDINNLCIEFDDLYMSDDTTKKEVLTALKNANFLTTDDEEKVIVDFDGEIYEIYAAENNLPLGRLEPLIN